MRYEDIIMSLICLVIYVAMAYVLGGVMAKLWKPMVEAEVNVLAGKVEERHGARF